MPRNIKHFRGQLWLYYYRWQRLMWVDSLGKAVVRLKEAYEQQKKISISNSLDAQQSWKESTLPHNPLAICDPQPLCL